MKDDGEKEVDAIGSELRQPDVMVVPGLEVLAGPLIMELGPIAGREIYRMIAEDQALSIRVEESWMADDEFYAVLRLINLTAHGVYVEKVACSSDQVEVSFSRSSAMFQPTMDFTGKAGAQIEWCSLDAFTPIAVGISLKDGPLLALKMRGVEFKPEKSNPLWQTINSLEFTVSLSRLDQAKRQERVVEVMLRRSGRK